MREILFKAKRKSNGEWEEGLLTVMWREYHIIDPKDEKIAYAIDPETICQFTGLYDKKGQKIWENDILEYSYDYPDSPWLKSRGMTNEDIEYRIGAVFWSDWRGSWSACSRGTNRGCNQDVWKYCRNPNRTEVIGNIFDNPELVKRREHEN